MAMQNGWKESPLREYLDTDIADMLYAIYGSRTVSYAIKEVS